MKTKETLLFIDMDGVIADFEKGINSGNGDLDQMFGNKFFRKLEPMEKEIAEKIERLQELTKVKILSKACVERNDKRFASQVSDKKYWLMRFAPTVENKDIIIQSTEESKGEIVREFSDYHCILLDDYSLNLVEWELAGGIGIKKAKRYKNERTFEQVNSLKDLIILLENLL